MKIKISWRISVVLIIISLLVMIGLTYNARWINYEGMRCLRHNVNVEAMDDAYILPSTSLENGEMYFFQPTKSKGFDLDAGERVSLSINIDTDYEDHCYLGYYVDGKFVEVFSGRVADKLNVGFTTKEAGIYKIFMFGASADSTKLTTGEIKVRKLGYKNRNGYFY